MSNIHQAREIALQLFTLRSGTSDSGWIWPNFKIHPRSIQDPPKIHPRSTPNFKIHPRSTQDPPKTKYRTNPKTVQKTIKNLPQPISVFAGTGPTSYQKAIKRSTFAHPSHKICLSRPIWLTGPTTYPNLSKIDQKPISAYLCFLIVC